MNPLTSAAANLLFESAGLAFDVDAIQDEAAVWSSVVQLAALDEIQYQAARAKLRKKFRTLNVRSLDALVRSARRQDAPFAERVPSADGYRVPTAGGQKLEANDLGRRLLQEHSLLTDQSGIVWEYTGLYWRRVSEGLLYSYAFELDSGIYTTRKRRQEAVSYALEAARRDSVSWRHLGDREVPVANGVLNIETCEIRPHSKADYLEAVVPHQYDPTQRPDLWLKTLDRWFTGDPDKDAKIDALQEFFGYALLPHARYKKALFLHGETDTGKSQVPLVLRALVGPENTCTLNTDQMADERKRAVIVGKQLNLMSELSVDAMIQDGGFKQLVSTGDPISIDPKYKEPFQYIPFCKHVICTNTLPQISDQTSATYNRLLLLNFNHQIPKSEQDDMLILKLTQEIVGILGWAIEGAARLVANRGKFTEIGESMESIAKYRQEQNPILSYIAEECGEDQDASIPLDQFRDGFYKWCGHQASKYSKTWISRRLASSGYKIKDCGSKYNDRFRVEGLFFRTRM